MARADALPAQQPSEFSSCSPSTSRPRAVRRAIIRRNFGAIRRTSTPYRRPGAANFSRRVEIETAAPAAASPRGSPHAPARRRRRGCDGGRTTAVAGRPSTVRRRRVRLGEPSSAPASTRRSSARRAPAAPRPIRCSRSTSSDAPPPTPSAASAFSSCRRPRRRRLRCRRRRPHPRSRRGRRWRRRRRSAAAAAARGGASGREAAARANGGAARRSLCATRRQPPWHARGAPAEAPRR